MDIDKWENLVERKEIDISPGETILAWNHCRKSKRSKENEGHCEKIEFEKKILVLFIIKGVSENTYNIHLSL